jgi:hypothetical protein
MMALNRSRLARLLSLHLLSLQTYETDARPIAEIEEIKPITTPSPLQN